jgi:MraZ protein
MFLTGAYPRAIDDKLRIALPKKLRDGLGGPDVPLYLAPGMDGSIALYNETEFNRIAGQLQHQSSHSQHVRAFDRMFFARAQNVETDPQGRLRIPADLAKWGNLEGGEVMLLGVRDHVEIWNRLRWESYVSELQPEYEQIVERVFDPTCTPAKEESAPAPEAASVVKPR